VRRFAAAPARPSAVELDNRLDETVVSVSEFMKTRKAPLSSWSSVNASCGVIGLDDMLSGTIPTSRNDAPPAMAATSEVASTPL
jgi:hypothetical protein